MNSGPIHSSLSESGRAGFVMANSAADARASELEIRSQIIKSGAVDTVVSIASKARISSPQGSLIQNTLTFRGFAG